MTNLSLVASESLQRDPRKLAFLYPTIPASRYKALTDEHYRLLTIKAAEDAARASGGILMPSTCLHRRRREPERRLMIFGRTYYVIPADELTEMEIEKYKLACLG